MAKCKNCKNLKKYYEISKCKEKEYDWCVAYNDSLDIERERDCAIYECMTNADRIRSMTDEELARVIFSSCVESMEIEDGCPHAEDMLNSEPSESPISCEECVLEWLKSEVEEE